MEWVIYLRNGPGEAAQGRAGARAERASAEPEEEQTAGEAAAAAD